MKQIARLLITLAFSLSVVAPAHAEPVKTITAPPSNSVMDPCPWC